MLKVLFYFLYSLKISESGFQDIINGAMNQLGASQFQIHPTYTSQSK